MRKWLPDTCETAAQILPETFRLSKNIRNVFTGHRNIFLLCFALIKKNPNFVHMMNQPLAERMRPTSLDDFYGQQHIVGKGKLLRRAIEYGSTGSMIFYGPPGTGKTTLAQIIAKTLNANIQKLNAVSSGVADAKAVIEKAKKDKLLLGKDTYLLLDECHRWSKSQSDCVLEAIEKGKIKVKATKAKMARGEMVRWLSENQIEEPEKIKEFHGLDYRYREEYSSDTEFVFLEKKQDKEEIW